MYMCIIISFGTAQKKKKKKKKKRFNQIWVFLLCTAIYTFGRLTINICHWHFLLWRSFLRVRCAAISIRLFCVAYSGLDISKISQSPIWRPTIISQSHKPDFTVARNIFVQSRGKKNENTHMIHWSAIQCFCRFSSR